MIRRKDSYQVDIREAMRGGSGKVKIEHFWDQTQLRGKTRLCAKLTLEPGSSIGFHEHHDEEEVFIVIRGQAQILDGTQQQLVNVGDSILTGGGAGHAVEAVGDEPLEMIAVIVQY